MINYVTKNAWLMHCVVACTYTNHAIWRVFWNVLWSYINIGVSFEKSVNIIVQRYSIYGVYWGYNNFSNVLLKEHSVGTWNTYYIFLNKTVAIRGQKKLMWEQTVFKSIHIILSNPRFKFNFKSIRLVVLTGRTIQFNKPQKKYIIDYNIKCIHCISLYG